VNLTVVDLESPSGVAVANLSLSGPPDSDIGFNHVAVAPDESRLYIGFVPRSGRLFGRGLADTIWAFDTKSGARLGAFALTHPAWHFALSADGKQLYTVNPFDKSLTVLDTINYREIATMRDAGDTPAQVVVPFMLR
jgi:YVTN family beta-propeller protein